VREATTRAQAGTWGWYTSATAPSLLTTLTCKSIQPGRQNDNVGFFCDRRIEAQIERALKRQATDPDAAVGMWRTIERRLVDRAPWVSLFTPWGADFVSKRVRNYQYSPVWGILLDQLWVR
jgi:ABC-type transport system substrate-binding protein